MFLREFVQYRSHYEGTGKKFRVYEACGEQGCKILKIFRVYAACDKYVEIPKIFHGYEARIGNKKNILRL